MYLGEDGIYYLGEEKKVKITADLIGKVYKELAPSVFSHKEPFCTIMKIEGKDYKFLFPKENNLLLSYEDESGKIHLINHQSTKIIFRVEGKDFERDIFTYEQYEKNLKIFNFSFPWSKNNIVTKNTIENAISENDRSSLIIIENIDFDRLIKSTDFEFNSFRALSKYINYYLKDDVNLEKYEEYNFIDNNFFKIDLDSKIKIFFEEERKVFLDEIISKFKKGVKEYFFTGLHSIGKTFTLLIFNSLRENQQNKAYFNLEALKKEENFLEIIIYESQNLFENVNKWKEAFIELKKKINDSRDYFNILYKLINLFAKKYIKKDTEYIIILDQIKFEQIDDEEYKYINKIREIIKKTNGVYLIGCCSINYKGVKDILFYNWEKDDNDKNEENDENDENDEIEKNEKNIPKLKYIKSSKFNASQSDISKSNKYLYLLGNTPRFKNIENKLNSKVVNLFLKKTKEKFSKFYGLKQFYEFEKIENIPVLKKFDKISNFLKELEKIPFKYFEIDLGERMFDFSCPIIKRAIEELLEEKELNEKIVEKNCELGWFFEKKVIYALRVKNILANKYYIDSSYLIPTIFLPHKIENLDLKENSLFYFEYCNVRRYDCAIYLGSEKALLLTQISIKKPKNKLDEYNSTNFQTDLEDMQRFININKLKVNKYYLLFILLYSNYKNNENLKTIKDSGFSYILYDLGENKFKGEIEKDLFEIPNTINSIIDINTNTVFFEFGKDNYSFYFNYKGKFHKYYAEENMSLERFFDEIFDETIKEEFKKATKFNFSDFYLKSDKSSYYSVIDKDLSNKVLLLNFKDGKIYYGSGKHKDDFVWNSYNLLTREKQYIKNYRAYLSMECFFFKNKKLIYPYK